MDFGWIVVLVVVWVLSAIGEQRKKQGNKPRPRSGAESASDERDVAVGPAAGRRDLARDIAESARRAEDALRRWEARQAEREATSPARRPTEARRLAETWRPAEAPAGVDEQRREAYQAIAEMLEGRNEEEADIAPAEVHAEVAPVEPSAPTRRSVRRASQIRGPSLLTKGGTLETARRPVAALEEPPVRTTESGLERIERLAPLQRAVVWSELLGPPVGMREGR